MNVNLKRLATTMKLSLLVAAMSGLCGCVSLNRRASATEDPAKPQQAPAIEAAHIYYVDSQQGDDTQSGIAKKKPGSLWQM
jgi:hypothetical protein